MMLAMLGCWTGWLACGTDSAGDSGSDLSPELFQSFLLSSSEGWTPVAGTSVSLSIVEGSTAALELRVYAGCNSLYAQADLEGETLQVMGVGMTEMACERELMLQDERLVDILMEQPRLILESPELVLESETVQLRFLPEDRIVEDRPLTETRWAIDSYLSGDSVSSLALEQAPVLIFQEDGSLELSDGCGDRGGSYLLEGDQLVTSAEPVDPSACPDAAAEESALHIEATLGQESLTWSIDGERLSLEGADLGISALASDEDS